MGNGLGDGELYTPGRLLSLRGPDGLPHVTLELFGGRVMRAETRFREPPTLDHLAMLGRAFREAGLGRFTVPRGGLWGRELVLEEFEAPALEPPEHGAQEAPGGDGEHAADEQQLDDA
jgi:hypothetical protein